MQEHRPSRRPRMQQSKASFLNWIWVLRGGWMNEVVKKRAVGLYINRREFKKSGRQVESICKQRKVVSICARQ